MLPVKKISKLSRTGSQSQNVKKAENTALDDSMDDFLMSRPLKIDR